MNDLRDRRQSAIGPLPRDRQQHFERAAVAIVELTLEHIEAQRFGIDAVFSGRRTRMSPLDR